MKACDQRHERALFLEDMRSLMYGDRFHVTVPNFQFKPVHTSGGGLCPSGLRLFLTTINAKVVVKFIKKTHYCYVWNSKGHDKKCG